ncbi:MAG: DUF4304 domain-containing protein [Planctomycetota bacterium]|jgi:hypothetical protein
MDSKTVNKEIRRIVRPVLKEAGFTAFSGRNSWRYAEDRIDVVNFQSFNSYNAAVIGCTTYSFALNLGCYLEWLPDPNGFVPKEVGGRLRPEEYHCPLRGRLSRGFEQPEVDTEYLWYIDPEAKYLPQSMEDVIERLRAEGFAWFEQFVSPEAVLRVFQGEEDMDRLWGFGNDPSPVRSFMRGYAALRCGELQLAREELAAALRSGSFGESRSRLESDIADCGSQ